CLNPPQEGIMNVSDPDEKKGMEAVFVEGLPVAHEGEPKQSIPGGRWFERRKSFERETERLEMDGRPGRPSAQLGGKIEVYTAPVEIGEGRRNADQHAGVGGRLRSDLSVDDGDRPGDHDLHPRNGDRKSTRLN